MQTRLNTVYYLFYYKKITPYSCAYLFEQSHFKWMSEWMNEWSIYIALYCVLLYTQSALQSYEGVSATGGEERERDRANQVDGDYWEAMIDKDQWRECGGNLARTPGYTPTLYDECHGIFNDYRESGPRFNVSSERRCSFDSIVSPSLYWGVRTHTDHRVSTPCWPH